MVSCVAFDFAPILGKKVKIMIVAIRLPGC